MFDFNSVENNFIKHAMQIENTNSSAVKFQLACTIILNKLGLLQIKRLRSAIGIDLDRLVNKVKECVENKTFSPTHQEQLKKLLNYSWKIQSTRSQPILQQIDNLYKSQSSSSIALAKWRSNYPGGFFAHAIWPGNEERVLTSGALKSGEQLLREGQHVEFEQGEFNSRGILKGVQLLPGDLQELHQLLSEEVKERLNKDNVLQTCGQKKSKELYKKFNELCQSFINEIDSDDYSESKSYKESKYWVEIQELYQVCRPHMCLKAFSHFKKGRFFIRQKYGFFLDNKLTLKSIALYLENLKNLKDVNYWMPLPFYDKVKELAKKYGCTRAEIQIAFDESLKEDKLDIYLYKKWKKKILSDDEAHVLREKIKPFCLSLNAEIRMLEDKIYWAYGDMIILKGFEKPEHKNSLRQDVQANEVLVSAPWHDPQGKFFEFNLNDPSILILGHKSTLESYKDKYKNLVFIEDLTQEQRASLKVPSRL